MRGETLSIGMRVAGSRKDKSSPDTTRGQLLAPVYKAMEDVNSKQGLAQRHVTPGAGDFIVFHMACGRRDGG